MLHSDIECFLDTLLYPILDTSLLFDDCFQNFFDELPENFIRPEHTSQIEKKRKIVYQKAANYIGNQCKLNTLDEIHQYMERWYLGQHVWKEFKKKDVGNDGREEKSKAKILAYDLVVNRIQQLAQSMISKFDGNFTYKYWENQGDAALLGGFSGCNKIHLFRGLNQIIPMDILVACFVLGSNQEENAIQSFYGEVAVTDALLEEVLKKGVAEDHIHMGASAGFPIIWEELMSFDVYFSKLSTENNLPFKSFDPDRLKDIYFYWAYARYLRMCVMIYITSQTYLELEPFQKDLFSEFLLSLKLSPNQIIRPGFLKKIYENCKNAEQVIELFAETDNRLVDFMKESEIVSGLKIKGNDYLEGVFLLRGLKSLNKTKTDDAQFVFKKLFLQYLCVKNYIFRTMVQHKKVEGLDYFQGYYGSLSKISNASKKFVLEQEKDDVAKLERLIWAQLSNRNIRKVEFRTSFADKTSTAQKMVWCFLKAYRNILQKHYCQQIGDKYHPVCELPRVGLVFHFIKSFQEMPDLCAETDDNLMKRYESLQKKYNKQMDVFLELRNPEKYPGIDRYLVGIDVASLENAVPSWVFCDVYEKARDGKSEPFLLDNKRPYQSLGFTCHAGEDFRHVMSGLRRIYEVIQYLKFHAGDRIGHGIALGINIDDWYTQHPNVVLPRMEALENYLWAYQMLSTCPSFSNSGDLLYLEKRIQQLSAEIFCNGTKNVDGHISTSILLKSYECLFRCNTNEELCNKLCDEVKKNDDCPLLNGEKFTTQDVLKAYHCHRFSSQMNEVIHYHLSPQEVAILKTLQSMMQEFVSRAGVIVEVNPSSNIVIGGIDTIHQHPMYSMTNYYCDYKDLMICVNSDDPGVFQTNVCNELGIAYMGMIERGIGREACLNWIDRLRENGMRSSFIRSRESDEELLRSLDCLIAALGN